MVKLPVFDVLGKAFVAPFKFAWPLLPFYLAVTAVFLGVFGFIFLGVFSPEAEPQEPFSLGWSYALPILSVVILMLALMSSIAVLTHRVAADVPSRWKLFGPVIRYIIVWLVLLLIGLVFFYLGFQFVSWLVPAELLISEGASPYSWVRWTAIALVLLTGFALGARLFLALPAVAIGKSAPIMSAWRISDGSSFRLLAAWLFYGVLVFAINAAAFLVIGGTETAMQNPELLGGSADTSAAGILGALGAGWLILNVVLNYYFAVAGAAFLSYSLIALLPNEDISSEANADASI